MNRALSTLCLLALWLAVPPFFAGTVIAADSLSPPPQVLNNPVAGASLAAELRANRPATNAELRGVLKIRRRDGQMARVPVVSRIVTGGAKWESIYEARGTNVTETLKVVRSGDAPNEYRHVREGEAGFAACPAPLPPGEIWRPFAGSDFSLGDLGLEFLHWPTQTLLFNEMRKNRACHVLESKPAQAGPYARVLSWVDVESGGIVMAEAYGPDGRRLKEFEVNGIKKVGDQWQVQKMEIRNLPGRSRTMLEFEVPGE